MPSGNRGVPRGMPRRGALPSLARGRVQWYGSLVDQFHPRRCHSTAILEVLRCRTIDEEGGEGELVILGAYEFRPGAEEGPPLETR